MVWRSSPSLRGLDFRQFRLIRRTFFPEYKKGRRLTDLCDHCAVYDRKIRPRTREFLVRAQRELGERTGAAGLYGAAVRVRGWLVVGNRQFFPVT